MTQKKWRRRVTYAFLTLGAAFGLYTCSAAYHAKDHEERTTTITYNMLQDIVENTNPIISHAEIPPSANRSDVERIMNEALGDDINFTRPSVRDIRRFDAFLDSEIDRYHRQRRTTGKRDPRFHAPDTIEGLILLAASITHDNMEYDHRAHFINHTRAAFEGDTFLGNMVDFIVRSGEVGAEYTNISNMSADEALYYRQGMCEEFADVFSAVLLHLNERFGSRFQISSGTVLSHPRESRNGFYSGLAQILNMYYFERWTDKIPHMTNIIISYDHVEQPHIYFVDTQFSDPFIDEDQVLRVDRETFEEYLPFLDLTERFSVSVYSQEHEVDTSMMMWSDIVLTDESVRMIVDDIGVREDVIEYVREHIISPYIPIRGIQYLRHFEGEATQENLHRYLIAHHSFSWRYLPYQEYEEIRSRGGLLPWDRAPPPFDGGVPDNGSVDNPFSED